ncbi:MAG: hypothetical protein ACP5VR_06035 [Acidimicrobiales bacterium]
MPAHRVLYGRRSACRAPGGPLVARVNYFLVDLAGLATAFLVDLAVLAGLATAFLVALAGFTVSHLNVLPTGLQTNVAFPAFSVLPSSALVQLLPAFTSVATAW